MLICSHNAGTGIPDYISHFEYAWVFLEIAGTGIPDYISHFEYAWVFLEMFRSDSCPLDEFVICGVIRI